MQPFSLAEIHAVRERLDAFIVETPVWRWHNRDIVGPILTSPRLRLMFRQQRGIDANSVEPIDALSYPPLVTTAQVGRK